MKIAVRLSQSAGCLAALVAITGCDERNVVLDANAVQAARSRQNRVCVEDRIWAQTPPRTDAQGSQPLMNLFGASLGNHRTEPASGPFYLRMTVTGGGRTESSPPPRAELPATTVIAPGRTVRTPFLVTVPAVAGESYMVDIRLWGPGDPDGGDNGYCQHRTFTVGT
ncbi:MAG: hypothetical protein QOH47_1899 [Sphingomonadales bacterium]|jgi:hypothetical protein|nr:hypothetical protein [Sphingomonadales bacterium]